MAAVHPITRQISSSVQDNKQASHNICLSELKNCFIFDRHGDKKSFSSLFEHNKAIVIFVRGFCSLTGFPHEIYVDPERQIYKRLGLRRGETYMETPSVSPHVKSSMLSGSLKSVWRAMTSPVFDFQGDPQQQGGALIVGPGPDVHFAHFDMNRLDHMPINWLLQLAGLPALDFSDSPKIINI
ncbi:peroxiredoxin-like 2C isoform X4 [Danio rerio]|uniref:Peroxiredoxin-like 2C isoform X4 n=1 Tax=Danio rerio TaxID=7955 RepID=A0A8M3AUT2_DANRE|nr:thioredoxin-like protein AAED1 isoform X4 [Danio rerio]|eukprot:XP_009301977.1 thioredoxin-like protein AAED1 isoform X4 [Danio rerio]